MSRRAGDEVDPDFLDAVEEASRVGPLPKPPATTPKRTRPPAIGNTGATGPSIPPAMTSPATPPPVPEPPAKKKIRATAAHTPLAVESRRTTAVPRKAGATLLPTQGIAGRKRAVPPISREAGAPHPVARTQSSLQLIAKLAEDAADAATREAAATAGVRSGGTQIGPAPRADNEPSRRIPTRWIGPRDVNATRPAGSGSESGSAEAGAPEPVRTTGSGVVWLPPTAPASPHGNATHPPREAGAPEPLSETSVTKSRIVLGPVGAPDAVVPPASSDSDVVQLRLEAEAPAPVTPTKPAIVPEPEPADKTMPAMAAPVASAKTEAPPAVTGKTVAPGTSSSKTMPAPAIAPPAAVRATAVPLVVPTPVKARTTLEVPTLPASATATPAGAPAADKEQGQAILLIRVGVAAVLLLLIGVIYAAARDGNDDTVDDRQALATASSATLPASKPMVAPEPAPEPTPAPVVRVVPEIDPMVDQPQPPDPDLDVIIVAEADIPSVDPDVSADAAPRSRRRRRRAPPVSEPEPEVTPVVETVAEPPRAARPPREAPPSASELLAQASAALVRGDAKQAYRLAKRSNSQTASEGASTLMAKAACRTGNIEAAKSALREVRLLDRAGIRKDCRQAGSRIGL